MRPGIDGVEAVRRIKDGVGVPVVYVTAHSDARTMDEARLTDPFGYITKPFDERDLEIAVEIAIRWHDVEQKLAEAKANAEAALVRGGQPRGLPGVLREGVQLSGAYRRMSGAALPFPPRLRANGPSRI